MNKNLRWLTAVVGIVLASNGALQAARAADGSSDAASPSELRSRLQSATWPADIVRLSDRLLSLEPASPAAQETRDVRDRAAVAAGLLSSRAVQLQRDAFVAADLPPDHHQDLLRAARGDKDSALSLARLYQGGGDSAPADRYRYLGWLQYAALLGNDSASYEAALYYRREGEPALAAVYEARAVAQGYVLPATLDNIRK